MPDGSVIAKQETDIPTPAELHQHLVDLARQALERALEELPEGESDVGRLRRAFGEHARERLAQTPIAIWLDVVRELGRNEGLAAAAGALKATANAVAQARRTATVTLAPRLGSERYSQAAVERERAIEEAAKLCEEARDRLDRARVHELNAHDGSSFKADLLRASSAQSHTLATRIRALVTK